MVLGCSPPSAKKENAVSPPPVALPLFVDWVVPPEAGISHIVPHRYSFVEELYPLDDLLARLPEEVAKLSAGGSQFEFIDGVPAIVPAIPGVSCLNAPVQGELTNCTLWEATEHVLRSIACDERFRDRLSLGFRSGLGSGMPESYWNDPSHNFAFDGLTAREALLDIIRASGYTINFVIWHKTLESTGEMRTLFNMGFYKNGKLQTTPFHEAPAADAPVRRAIDMQRAVTPLENCPGAAETPAP